MKQFLVSSFVLWIGFMCLPFALSPSQAGEKIPFKLKQQEVNLSNAELISELEKSLFDQTNLLRQNKALKIFEANPVLLKVGRAYSKDMLQRNFFSHFDPEGRSVLERIQKVKKGFDEDCAENLHHIYSPGGLKDPQAIAKQMMQDWMGSPPHRKNLIAKNYHFMEVGCATDGFKVYCTQVFSGMNL